MRYLVALLLTSVAVLHAAEDADPKSSPNPLPNFVIIMVDDMGYAGVSCFGNPYFQTPEIDRLAHEGMRLTDFHSSGTVCSPTRAGLLTGRYQQRAGIEAVIHPVADHPEHRKGLQKVEATFAESLQDVGYATGLVGKWHQGYVRNSDDFHPQNHGFDEFIGYPQANPGSFDNEQVELYRLDQDSSEKTDLASREPAQVQSMLANLKAWYADTQRTATPQPGGW